MTQPSRFINSVGAPKEIPRLLQSIFIGELINPSNQIWLVSPWISDITMIDNTTNSFTHLEPSWNRTKVRLSQVLSCLINLGVDLVVATRPDPHNNHFRRTMESLTPPGWSDSRLFIVDELHEKGLLGEEYYLAGSMNFTYNGITAERQEEAIHYHVNPEIVGEQRIKFRDRWGN